jgi:ABC-type transporter Mla subunit MlaD
MTEAATRAEGQINGASDSLREQLEKIRAGLQGQIDDINRGLMQITAQLERTGASLRSTTVGAVADVERIGQRFEHTGGEAVAKVEARTQQMRAATEDVAKLLAGFGGQFDQILSHMAKAGDGIKRQEGDMVGQLQRMLTHLGTVAEKLESARNLSGNVTQQTIERLDEVVNAVQAHMNSMTAGAQTAAGVMRGIGQIYGDQTQILSKGVSEAHQQVLTMNQSIDDMQARTDRMRDGLKAQGDELMNSLRQILSQLEQTGDGLTEAVNRTLEQQANAGLQKIG